MNWRNDHHICWTISGSSYTGTWKFFQGSWEGFEPTTSAPTTPRSYMRQSLRIYRKCEHHFFNQSLNHTTETFLSCVKRSARRRWWGDWAEWVSPVLLLATSDFPAISYPTRNLTRECYYSQLFAHLYIVFEGHTMSEKKRGYIPNYARFIMGGSAGWVIWSVFAKFQVLPDLQVQIKVLAFV